MDLAKLVKPKFAFTLAEVLITLGIIGIISAITIPSVIQNKYDKETVSRLKKVYSSLSQAYLFIFSEYGEPTNWGIVRANEGTGNTPTVEGAKSSANLANMFAKNMQTTKNCGVDTGCFSSLSSVYNRGDVGKIILNDGTTLGFAGLSNDCTKNRGDTKHLSSICAWIIVDINGSRRPNMYGVDIFEFALTKYGILPYGTPEDTVFSFENSCKNFKSDDKDANHGCTAWVLVNENLDYRKCSDLGWNTKTKCKK